METVLKKRIRLLKQECGYNVYHSLFKPMPWIRHPLERMLNLVETL